MARAVTATKIRMEKRGSFRLIRVDEDSFEPGLAILAAEGCPADFGGSRSLDGEGPLRLMVASKAVRGGQDGPGQDGPGKTGRAFC
jgi:hypothetical protein